MSKRKSSRIIAVLILAVLFTASMTWCGAPAKLIVEAGQPIPPTASSTLPEPDALEVKPCEPDALEVEALARMLYGEARGVPSTMEKAACVWCVLNRVDDTRFPDTVLDVLEAPYQFAGYNATYPVLPELAEIAADVLTRYHAERDGDTEAGRVLPAEYAFFTGDGRNNHFRTEWRGGTSWDWSLPSPYEEDNK